MSDHLYSDIPNRTGRLLKNRGNKGLHMFCGRQETAFDNTTQKTFHTVMSTALHYDAIQVILSTANATDVAVTKLAVCPVPTAVDLNVSSGTWTSLTFSGSASGTIPARSKARIRTFLISDILQFSSVARTDGGDYPLVAIRAYLGGSATITMLGNSAGTDSFTNWVTNPSGRIHCMRYNDGDCIGTPTNFVSTTDRNTSPIVGIIYYSRGKVVNVASFGDSIANGRGTYKGENFVYLACRELTAESNGVAYECSNLGWDGGQMNDATNGGSVDHITSAIAAGLPIHIAVTNNAGTNDFAAGGLTVSAISTEARQPLAKSMGELQSAGIPLIVWTMLPVNSAVKDWGSSDSIRINYNEEVKNFAGWHVVDASAVMSGVPGGSGGAIQQISSLSEDGIHPNTAGNTAIAQLFKVAIKQYV